MKRFDLVIKVKNYLELARKEVELRNSELKFRNIFHSSIDGIVIFDFEHRLLESNHAFSSLFRFADDDLSRLYITNMIHPNDVNDFKRWVVDLKAPVRNPSSFETRVVSPDRSTRTMELSGRIILYQDQKAVLAIFRDITERKELHLKVLNAVIQTEEKERRRFAQDLHDGLGPLLSTLKLYSNSILTARDAESKKLAVDRSLEIIDEAIVGIREIANNISPNILRDFGLDVAVKSYVSKFNDTKRINIYFRSDLKTRFNTNIEGSLFRIIIELINNTIKHAYANNVTIELIQKDGELILRYSDDGIGFNLKSVLEKSAGHGLQNIIHRAESINGDIRIDTGLDKGLNLQITLNTTSIQ